MIKSALKQWCAAAVLLGLLVLSSSGSAWAADEKAAALAELNLTRQLAGLSPVSSNALISQAAQAHADYLQTNLNGISHDESPGMPGFTGVGSFNRLMTAGYGGCSSSEVISGGVASGQQAVQGLVQAIYHRFPILDPIMTDVGIGIGSAKGKSPNVVINFGTLFCRAPALPPDSLRAYPVEGQTAVTTDFFSDTEIPDPVPALNQVGYPVSIHAGPQETLTVSRFTLAPVGAAPVATKLLSYPADSHVPANAAAIVPLAPLADGTRYQADFSGTRNGQAVTLSWRFTTARLMSIDLPNQYLNTAKVARIQVNGGAGAPYMKSYSAQSSNPTAAAPRIVEISTGLFEVSVSAAADVTVVFSDQDGQTKTATVSFVDPIALRTDLPYQRVDTSQVARIQVSGGNGSSYMKVYNWTNANAGNPSPQVTQVSPGLYEVRVASAANVIVTFADQIGQTLDAKVNFVDPISETTRLVPDWNLVGNPLQTPVVVAERFGRTSAALAGVTDKVISVWKWLPSSSRWAFYTPVMSATELASFAAAKGYAVLERIEPGEGYWINASAALSLPSRTGLPVTTVPAALATGWSLLGTGGEAMSPAAFDKALRTGTLSDQSLCYPDECWQVSGGLAATPAIQSLWTWDGSAKRWRFYAPGLALQGGSVLSNYALDKGYTPYDLNENLHLRPGEGFWVASNTIAATLPPPSPWPDQTVPFDVSQSSQRIVFGAAPVLVLGGTGALAANGGASGNTVVLTSSTPGICTVAGNTVTALAAGNCVVAANQAGNASYSAASQVTQTITIDKARLDVQKGWNLLGHAAAQPLAVTHAFADTTIFITVWKWDALNAIWQFYAPSMDAAALLAYASSKGYGVLSEIKRGEGYWVNTKTLASLEIPIDTPFKLSANDLLKGWNLVATGNDVTPAALNLSLSASPPTAGVTPVNVTTLWAWNSLLAQWYFYAPQLDANGGLLNYVTGKNYLDFSQHNKTLGQGVGFWVNKP